MKLDPAGQVVLSTYLGGTGADQGQSVAADPAGAVYLAGITRSADFPVTGGVPRSCAAVAGSLCGRTDAFVARIDPAGELG